MLGVFHLLPTLKMTPISYNESVFWNKKKHTNFRTKYLKTDHNFTLNFTHARNKFAKKTYFAITNQIVLMKKQQQISKQEFQFCVKLFRRKIQNWGLGVAEIM